MENRGKRERNINFPFNVIARSKATKQSHLSPFSFNFPFSLSYTVFLTLPLLAVVCLLSCAKHEQVAEMDPEDEFKLAKQSFQEENYDRAIAGFKRVMFRHPGSKWAEEAQYRLAQSSFLKKDYETAEMEYEFFVKSYPRSRFVDDASFELALSYFRESPSYSLDPLLIKRALHEFQSFIRKYPESKWLEKAKEYEQKCIDKFVLKELEIAKLYIKMDKPESAALYLKSIQQEYPENSYSDEISHLLKQCENE